MFEVRKVQESEDVRGMMKIEELRTRKVKP
jgi:hypothetical protein